MLHMLTAGKQRMVLGDWREDSGEAIIARQQSDQAVHLETWRF
jgi:UDP-2,3-diacylglucosamine pyrophosphatase LpxH